MPVGILVVPRVTISTFTFYFDFTDRLLKVVANDKKGLVRDFVRVSQI